MFPETAEKLFLSPSPRKAMLPCLSSEGAQASAGFPVVECSSIPRSRNQGTLQVLSVGLENETCRLCVNRNETFTTLESVSYSKVPLWAHKLWTVIKL